MADKEQELLEKMQIACKALSGTYKALDYVKWNREKVAQMGYEFLGIGWDKLTEASKDIFRERADQLHKILTGGGR